MTGLVQLHQGKSHHEANSTPLETAGNRLKHPGSNSSARTATLKTRARMSRLTADLWSGCDAVDEDSSISNDPHKGAVKAMSGTATQLTHRSSWSSQFVGRAVVPRSWDYGGLLIPNFSSMASAQEKQFLKATPRSRRRPFSWLSPSSYVVTAMARPSSSPLSQWSRLPLFAAFVRKKR